MHSCSWVWADISVVKSVMWEKENVAENPLLMLVYQTYSIDPDKGDSN